MVPQKQGDNMLAVIGGTGLYALEGLKVSEHKEVSTPFGKPSSPILCGEFQGQSVFFLPRHGANHEFLPSEVNYRANIWALKSLGVKAILSVSATGSLNPKIKPGELGLVSQYFDWTKGKRASSFFGEGIVAHISTAHPCCPILTEKVLETSRKLDIPLHSGLTYACVEGPRMGTKAESFFLKNAGCDLVGMTNVPEAFLALEAQLSYLTLAIATDFDCWLEDENQHAQTSEVLTMYKKNLGRIQKLLLGLFAEKIYVEESPSRKSLEYAFITNLEKTTASQKAIIDFLKK